MVRGRHFTAGLRQMPVIPRFFATIVLFAASLAPFAGLAKSPAAPPADTLTATMAGEYALQAGRLDEASDWYLQAARSADGDAGLAERATRISLLANDNLRSTQALGLWRARAPRSLAMRAAEATLSLRKGNVRAARRELEALLRDADPDGWRYALAALGSGAKDQEITAQLLGQLVDANAIPNLLQPWLAFGGMAQRLGQDALAEQIVDDVIKRFPASRAWRCCGPASCVNRVGSTKPKRRSRQCRAARSWDRTCACRSPPNTTPSVMPGPPPR